MYIYEFSYETLVENEVFYETTPQCSFSLSFSLSLLPSLCPKLAHSLLCAWEGRERRWAHIERRKDFGGESEREWMVRYIDNYPKVFVDGQRVNLVWEKEFVVPKSAN